MSCASLLVALALAAPSAPPDPCAAAAAPLPKVEGVAKDAARAVEAYRLAWRRACEEKTTAALATLLGDGEALARDARLSRSVRAIASAAAAAGGAWPLPGLHAVDREVAVDWAAFAPVAAHGTVSDLRFWRGASVAADRAGEPSWVEEAPRAAAGVCVRLGQTAWPELAAALDDMEAAREPQYADHARELRQLLVETLGAIAKGPEICGCVRGDPVAGLDALATAAADARRGTPEQRALSKAAADAVGALRGGRVRVRWLRDAPGAEPTGCGAAP
jgi:antitoxin (DNA-binding transcriptional repressor) of toxin-antitoxin stability system